MSSKLETPTTSTIGAIGGTTISTTPPRPVTCHAMLWVPKILTITVTGGLPLNTAMSGTRGWIPAGRPIIPDTGRGSTLGDGRGSMKLRGAMPHSITDAGLLWATAGDGYLDPSPSGPYTLRRWSCSSAALAQDLAAMLPGLPSGRGKFTSRRTT